MKATSYFFAIISIQLVHLVCTYQGSIYLVKASTATDQENGGATMTDKDIYVF